MAEEIRTHTHALIHIHMQYVSTMGPIVMQAPHETVVTDHLSHIEDHFPSMLVNVCATFIIIITFLLCFGLLYNYNNIS